MSGRPSMAEIGGGSLRPHCGETMFLGEGLIDQKVTWDRSRASRRYVKLDVRTSRWLEECDVDFGSMSPETIVLKPESDDR